MGPPGRPSSPSPGSPPRIGLARTTLMTAMQFQTTATGFLKMDMASQSLLLQPLITLRPLIPALYRPATTNQQQPQLPQQQQLQQQPLLTMLRRLQMVAFRTCLGSPRVCLRGSVAGLRT